MLLLPCHFVLTAIRRPVIRKATKKLLLTALILLPASLSWAQRPDSTVFHLDSLPGTSRGVLLDRGWRWHPGDDPDWAGVDFDDSRWEGIDPTRDIMELPQVRKAGIGWLRLHLRVDSAAFAQQALVMRVMQSSALELYINGHLRQQLGRVSSNAGEVKSVFKRRNVIFLPAAAKSEYVLAVRVAFQPGLPSNRFANNPNFLYRVYINDVERHSMDDSKHNLFVAFVFTSVGLFFILSLLHFFFFLFYPSQRANLFFAVSVLIFCHYWFVLGLFQVNQLTDLRLLMYLGWLRGALCPFIYIFLVMALYAAFDLPRSSYFRASLAACGLLMAIYLTNYNTGVRWIEMGSAVVMLAEALRITIIAVRQKRRGATIVLVGLVMALLGMVGRAVNDLTTWLPFERAFVLPYDLLRSWPIPIFLSIYLAWEFAHTSRNLRQQLVEVKRLSDRAVAQEEERQQILSAQNERLEEQVARRTAQLRQQSEQLREAQEQLLAADSLKTRFFDNITHELRTPLTLILAPAETLLAEETLPTRRGLLTTIERNARQLLNLINQLLDLSKLEAGKMAIDRVQCSLPGFVSRLVDTFRPTALQRQLTLTFESEGLPGERVIDAGKWERILSNLLANAIKFTPERGMVSVALLADTQDRVRLTVEDTGIGIPADTLPHIFDRFYQADNSQTRKYEGTGIGLALVKELTDLLGGTIDFSSEVGRGTRVTLVLPVRSVRATAAPADVTAAELDTANSAFTNQPLPRDESTGHVVTHAGKPVLVLAEDNAELREFMAHTLSDEFRILTAADGEQAWQLARREIPDLVISDVMMPVMDGFALCRHIKADPATDHAAVVLLTARSSQDSRLEGFGYGADEYLVKPFHMGELRLRVHNLVEHQQKLRQYYGSQLGAGGAVPPPGAVENDFLRKVYELLERQLDNTAFGVDELAESLAMSRRTLHRKLTSLVDLPAGDLIRRYRLRRAAELLRQGHPVAQTAYQVGFESPQYFSTVFKEFYHHSPSEYAGR
jgi:signal transduction histidine kinase/DNA-binding response OmpR family regulator